MSFSASDGPSNGGLQLTRAYIVAERGTAAAQLNPWALYRLRHIVWQLESTHPSADCPSAHNPFQRKACMTDLALHPHLAHYRRQHEEISTTFERLLGGMTPEQFNFCPAAGRWTIGQNIEHLNLEGDEQVGIIERLIERGTAQQIRNSNPDFRYSVWGNWYIRFLEPPYRARIRTLKRYAAAPQLALDTVVPRFFGIKRRILTLVEQANGLDLARLTAPLPYLAGWNPSLALGQWFAYVAVHERRHFWQIQNIRSRADYPRG
jgi:hypothetical protein